jgi:N6-L-threonylcarbamoyladenine synthase
MSDFILAIESSCDETSAAILNNNTVLSNIISTQYFHTDYGGIVPELASRAHIKVIDVIVSEALAEADVSMDKIGLVAATEGPGLIGSLLVGYNYAKAIAVSAHLPFAGINHIESHLYSCFIGEQTLPLPFIALVVSGGHTILFLVEDYFKYRVLGQTHDDAAGEAFDKVAKMLGLGYPGGPVIDSLAKLGDEKFHNFPVSKLKDNPYDFSFSGIKTSVLYYLKKNYPAGTIVPVNDICASFQRAVVKNLTDNTMNAAAALGVKHIAVSGGVSANSGLRRDFLKWQDKGFEIKFPEPKYSTDNAAMIGYTAFLKSKHSIINFPGDTIGRQAFARFNFEQIR